MAITCTILLWLDNITYLKQMGALTIPLTAGTASMEAVNQTKHYHSHRAPSRTYMQIERLATPSTEATGCWIGTSFYGWTGGSNHSQWTFCLMHKSPAGMLLQLETRSSSVDSGQIVSVLEGVSTLHVSTICPNSSMLGQTESGAGLSTADRTCVAQSSLVSAGTALLDGATSPPTTDSGHSHKPNRCESPPA